MIKSSWIALIGSVFCITSAHTMPSAPVGREKNQHFQKLQEKKIQSKKNLSVSCQASSKSLASNIDDSFSEDAELFVTYEPNIIPLDDMNSLKLRWSMIFAEALIQSKVQAAIKDSFNYFDVYTDGKHFTPSFLSIQLRYLLSDENEVINYLEREIDHLLNAGISIEEFESARTVYKDYLADLLKEDKSEDEEFVYDCLCTEYEEEASFLTFKEFLLTSYECLQNMTCEEVLNVLPVYFSSENKVLESFFLNDFENKEDTPSSDGVLGAPGEEFCGAYQSSSKEKASGFSSLKRGLSDQAGQASVELFHQLRLTETDKKLIKKLVTTMADKNVFQLLLEKKSLEKKGKQIRPIHPLRFLGYICADGHMKKCLHSISKNHFKWSSFVDGFKDRMKEEAKKGELLPYVSGFAQVLNVDPNVVVSYINKSDYEGLVRICI